MRRTWDKITNEILAQRRIELAARRRRYALEDERRKLEEKMRRSKAHA